MSTNKTKSNNTDMSIVKCNSAGWEDHYTITTPTAELRQLRQALQVAALHAQAFHVASFARKLESQIGIKLTEQGDM